jgi:hypothetical protein
VSRLLASVLTRMRTSIADERGEVNVSMISWMVVSALVIFALRTQITTMMSAAVGFVMATLGI